MSRSSDGLRRLFAHWPELSERQRLVLVLAVAINAILSMGLEVVSTVAVGRAGLRLWRGRHGSSAGRVSAASPGAAGVWTGVSILQKIVARLAFTGYERRLSRASTSESS